MPGRSHRLGHTARSAQSAVVEVATAAADALHATIRVTGPVGQRAVPLFETVLGTHLRAGRRYLRVDLGAAELSSAALRALADAAETAAALGGALVVENASPDVAAAIAPVKRTPAHA